MCWPLVAKMQVQDQVGSQLNGFKRSVLDLCGLNSNLCLDVWWDDLDPCDVERADDAVLFVVRALPQTVKPSFSSWCQNVLPTLLAAIWANHPWTVPALLD